MARRIFLTGGSGFVGSNVIGELLNQGYSVNALVRQGKPSARDGSVRPIRGDLFDAAALDAGMRDCEAAIHLVGIIIEKPLQGITFERIHLEGTRAVIDAARRNGIKRYIHMSALGARPDAVSEYHRTKWKAEQLVRDSGLDWTIFRPSIIHGPGGFMRTEAKWVRKAAMPFVVMPYFGAGPLGMGGSGLLQPVWVRDVARAFVDALKTPQSIHKTYDLVGPEQFTWPQFHGTSAMELTGRRRLTAPLPAWFAKLAAGAGLGPLLGFSRDQVIMSQENNTGNPAPFQTDFGWATQPFRAALREYAGKL